MLSKGIYLVLVSMLVFGILNIIENLIHYSIGRSHDNGEYIFYFPYPNDLIKIITIMIIFAFAQGLLTEILIKD